MDKLKFFSGFVWKFSERTMSQLVSFIVSIVLARILTPTDYGLVALVNVFIIIADVFVTSGFSSSLIQKKDANKTDFSSIFYCSLIFSIFVYLLVYITAPIIANFYHNNQLILILRVFALRLPISAFNSIQQAYVSRKLAFKKIFISTSFATIFSGIVGILLALRGFGVWALVFQYLINSLVETIVLFFQIPWHPQLLFSWKSTSKLLSYGWKILATDLLGQLFNQLRSLVIGRFYTPASLAYYNRGQQFPNILSNNIDVTITSVLFPAMSKYADDKQKLKAVVRRSIRTSTYILMPLMFGMAVVAKPMILLILTKKWINAVPFMQCLCISGAFGSINTANMQAIKASGRSDVLLKLELIKKPVYLVFLFASIRISVLAVAITMAMYSISAVFMNMFPNKKIINYSYGEQLRDIFPSLSLSIVMAGIVYLVSFVNLSAWSMLIVQVLLGSIIYLVGSIILHMEPFIYLVGYVKIIIGERKNAQKIG
ncbi:lipopolysaccharide biosynthesis protein [Limosilactobacillus reuteri]|uniref:lipopolysaccharide biosynthesis protein n=1 Tax=Limosilactobacillus reuteri TaxID=1598 RepID=UPI0015823878|nr:lipopolysaccharide biosynthesis protein [Limosilactobacillus reuteri]QKT15264.1 lipopolysaccharide biosynthesis protein [Limosilactobacillus reuteri]